MPHIILTEIAQAGQEIVSEYSWSLPLYLLIGMGYLLLILYVAHAKRVRETGQSISENNRLSTDSLVSSQMPLSSENDIQNLTEILCSQLNTVHVQQFIANIISVLESFRKLKEKMQDLPELNEAFPRRFQEEVLDDTDLIRTIKSVTKQTRLTEEHVIEYIERKKKAFLQTQGLSIGGDFEKRDVREIIQQIEHKHKHFNGFEILHEARLMQILKDEGLEIIPLKGIEVLSAIVQYRDNQEKSHHAVLVKNDDDIHPALKEFVLAHEIGHWFLHIDSGEVERTHYNIDFFLHSFHDVGPFENEANKIAMIALFPTPYLSWCDVFDKLDVDHLLQEFTINMPPVTGRLERYMKAYIKKRIEGYHKYRQLQLQQLRLPDTLIKEAAIRPLLEHVLMGVAWARLDENAILVDANEKYAELFNLTKAELIEKKYSLIDDLTEESLKEQTKKQMEIKEKTLKPKFYVTKYKNPIRQEVIPVTIYAFPIINDDDKYIGSFGVVTDIRGGI